MSRLFILVLSLLCGTAHSNKKNFCKPLVDYTPRYDTKQTRKICSTVVRSIVEEKTEAACLEVVNMECDVIVVPECSTVVTKNMTMMDIPAINTVELNACTKNTVMNKHVKEVYECSNVTKTHCTTLWKLDDKGMKVWAGNEDDCKEVTWEECKPVEKIVEFPEPHMECKPVPVSYNDVDVMLGEVDLVQTDCVAKPQQVCNPVRQNKCGMATYTVVTQVTDKVCKDITILVPHQDEIHKQWCLFNQVDNIDFDAEVKNILENQAPAGSPTEPIEANA